MARLHSSRPDAFSVFFVFSVVKSLSYGWGSL
jgi:hypothetical protein